MKSKAPLLGFLLLAVLVQPGCLTYHTSWKKQPPAPEPDPIEGRWKGTWLSNHNGHKGKLRAVATHIEDDQYRFQFGATYMLFLTASYDVQFTITEENGQYTLTGEQELPGYMGGLYNYEGSIQDGDFTSSYRSKLDHGTFQMTKVEE